MNAYIEILNFANKDGDTSFDELYRFITEKKITFGDGIKISERNSMLLNIYRRNFQNSDGDSPTDDVHKGRFFLKGEALAYLLSYYSLEQAKADSATARLEALKASKQSTWAIIISIASLIVSTLLSIYLR